MGRQALDAPLVLSSFHAFGSHLQNTSVRDIVGIICVLVCVCLAGCGPRVGNVIDVSGQTVIVLDQHDYEEYAELKAAGADTKGFTDFIGDTLTPKHKWTLLMEGSKVRVLGFVPGGVKVFVDRGMDVDWKATMETPWDDVAPGTTGKTKKQTMKESALTTGITGYIHLSDLRR
jgi:hypothetical protein